MDEDIKKMFEEKNRLIIINNLEYDLDRNINSMKDTISNIFTREFDYAIKNIILILSDYGKVIKEKEIYKIVNVIENRMLEKVLKTIENKKESLMSSIQILDFKEDTMLNYYEYVNSTTKVVKNLFDKDDVVAMRDKFIDKLLLLVLKEDTEKYLNMKSRLEDYITIRLFEKLITKIIDEVDLRDNNLLNKAKESYIKYQEICCSTMHE